MITSKQIKSSLAFIDTEIEPRTGKVLDIGAIKNKNEYFHKASINEFIQFLKGTDFVCGHNVLNHDLKYIGKTLNQAEISVKNVIDTLFLSPLLFPTRPYHALLKDDKLQTDELNNPLNDSIKARDLFRDEVDAFIRLDDTLRKIYYLLLKDQPEFQAFFRFLNYSVDDKIDLEQLIRNTFKNEICDYTKLSDYIKYYPVELAYGLSLIYSFITNKKLTQ